MKGIKGEKEMKKKMIDIRNRNAKIIVFALVAVLLLIGTVGLASASAAVMSTTRGGGLIAYYPFNGDAKDKSGNGIDGTVYGATWVDNGGCGKALSFDGNEDSVQIPHTVINNLLDITFSAWINTSEYDAGILTGANSGDADEFLIYITKGLGVLKPHVKNDYLSSERIINDGSWHYISVVREGSSGIVKIFIDGQLDNTKRLPTGNLNIDPSGLWLGREQDCVGGDWDISQDFDGIIDEVRIYNYALSQSQIQEDMRKCTPAITTPTPTPTPAPIITKYKKCVGDEPYLYVGDRIMGKGKTVEIPIIMCNAKDLANMDLDWSYDASVLKLIDVTKGSLNKKALFEWNEVSRGKLKIAFASSKGVSGSGSIAVMKFEVIGNTGAKSTITGTVDTASKTDGSTISVGVNPGEVTVGTPPIKGDCDGDNKLTSRDALAALQISVQKRPFDICYDYNGDGKVNSADARDILKAIVTGGK